MEEKYESLIRKLFYDMMMEKIKTLQEEGFEGEKLEVEFRLFFEEILYIVYTDLNLKTFSETSDDDDSSEELEDEISEEEEEEEDKIESTLKIGTLWLTQDEAVSMITDGIPIPALFNKDDILKRILHHLNGFLNKNYFASPQTYSDNEILVTYNDHQICTIHIHEEYIQMMDAPNVDSATITAQVFPAIVTFLYPEEKETKKQKSNKIDKSVGKINKDTNEILKRFKKRYLD